MNELLTTRQVQETLKVDRTTIYRMLKDGRLNGVKVGSQWRFPRLEIEAVLQGTPITEISNSCRFCNLILSTESGQRACIDSWRKLSHQHEIHPRITTCHAGFQYARARIEVNDVPTSMFVAGQFYTTLPETAVQQQHIQQLAETHGLDAAELTEAIHEVPVLAPFKQKKITEWLEKVALTFSLIGQERADMMERFRFIARMSDLESGPLSNGR